MIGKRKIYSNKSLYQEEYWNLDNSYLCNCQFDLPYKYTVGQLLNQVELNPKYYKKMQIIKIVSEK